MSRIPGKQVVLDTDITLSADSDIVIASQKAVKAYVDTQIGGVVSSYKGDIIGDDSTTTFSVVHSLNTDDIMIQVYEAAGDKENIGVTIGRIDVNTLSVKFAVAPPIADTYRVMILAI